ncbi:MAG: HAD-superfamily hydrolase, subfamily variant 3 [Gammaproteobacteria bacterium]|jgi:hypothetical protein|nr:HAD-superfamily hydrolase, subfamily variant 3 [Gammaproteobacteria bacterium]
MSKSRITRFLAKSASVVGRQFHEKPPLSSRQFSPTPFNSGKWLGLAMLSGVTASTFYYVHKKQSADHAKETYIVTIGSLLQLNYQASIAAFQQIAAKENKQINITNALLQDIFKEDDLFKRGEIDESIFRARINTILGINASDEEFDYAWNAMLGDTKILADRMKVIKNLGINLAFLSGTNPIHAKKLGFHESQDMPVFLSYKNGCVGVKCYEKMRDQLGLNPHKTTLVLRVDNLNSGSISERNQHFSDTAEAWAASQGIKICKCGRNVEIISAIEVCIADQKKQENNSHSKELKGC